MSNSTYQRLTREEASRGSWGEVFLGVALLLLVALAFLVGPAWIGEDTSAVFDESFDNNPATWPWFEGAEADCRGEPGCPDVAAPPRGRPE